MTRSMFALFYNFGVINITVSFLKAMKTITIIDGGPRKNMNTAKAINAFAEGAKSIGSNIDVKTFRLYDIDYKGCISCLACKLKNSKHKDVCAYKDGLSEVLYNSAYADALIFASPIYFGQITAQLRAYIERLVFPWLSYNDYSVTAPKRIPTAFIYTMNIPEEAADMISGAQEQIEGLIAMGLEMPERINVFNTLQVKDYNLYDMAGFSTEKKQEWHDEHWHEEMQNAYNIGRRIALKITT